MRDSIDSLSWLFNDERYLYRENKRLYINRFQLVIDTVNRIQRFLEMGYDDSRFAEPNYIHVPAIVQEYSLSILFTLFKKMVLILVFLKAPSPIH